MSANQIGLKFAILDYVGIINYYVSTIEIFDQRYIKIKCLNIAEYRTHRTTICATKLYC